MIAYMPIPHCRDAVLNTAEMAFPEIQVLIKNGRVGMKEKSCECSGVTSAMITSTSSSTHVYPISYKTELLAKVWTFFAVVSMILLMT